MTVIALAQAYHTAVHAAAGASVDAEEEAQLTTPVSNLFSGLAAQAGLGTLSLIRETRLDGTRPDFAVLLSAGGRTRQKGFVELKAPTVTVDTSQWRGRNLRQWERLRLEAEILIVCNGREAQIYRDGQAYLGSADLPYDDPAVWNPEPLIRLVGEFLQLNPTPVINVRNLSSRLAYRTAALRDRLLWLLDQAGGAGEAARGGLGAWRRHIHPAASPRDFADGVSQVIAYGMVIAALGDRQGVDSDGDGLVTVAEARAALRQSNPVLAAAFAPLLDKADLAAAAAVELGALETLISAIDRDRVNASADTRGEPWLYFYEDFLSVYDPDERRQAGVYYTPVAVVGAMVSMTDHLLANRFGRRLGFADPDVVTLDPAAGSGAFAIAVIDRAARRATAVRGAAGAAQAAENLSRNLLAFELLPGPYSVAHLRLGQRLSGLRAPGAPPISAQVVLTDTLESPTQPPPPPDLFGDAEVLAAEQQRAQALKRDRPVTVVIGNPPYRRVERDLRGRGSGGWILEGRPPGRQTDRSLFDDLLDVARANTIFAHHASLYNLYVYFWRWALWKAFEAHAAGPGVVSFITGSSWLTGPGFMGLRQLVRELADDVWVLDLGGDNHGPNPEQNVFAIETPVAVVVLARDGASDRSTPARVHYRRVRGTADQKLAAMAELAAAEDPFAGDWSAAPDGWLDPLVPTTGDAAWAALPALTDLFPWQQPGCKFGRTWPIAPDAEVLRRRWARLVAASREEKPRLFVTATSGRTVETRVERMPRLVDTTAASASEPIQRYAYRSFDRQWAFNDPRMAKTESPSLWQSQSDNQIFLSSTLTAAISRGPALTASAFVPDLHIFNGRGGKDIIPLYRDAAAAQPNLAAGLPQALGLALGINPPTVEDVAAYVYALLSTSAYQARFAQALQTPGLRLPLTADADLWRRAVEAGRHRLWLHTFAERLRDPAAGRGSDVPLVDGIGWDTPVTRMPADGGDIDYDRDEGTLRIADGLVTGVRNDVWTFEVSGMQVLPKWLGYRTARPAGRAASSSSELDRIRPETWPDAWNDELLDLIRVLTLTLDGEPALADLLDSICDGPLVEASLLPSPAKAEGQPPATLPRAARPVG
jgi:hypothetical protein